MLKYAENLVNQNDDESALMLRLIAKIFYSSIRSEVPRVFMIDFPYTAAWYSVWDALIRKPLTAFQCIGDDINDLSLRPWLVVFYLYNKQF